MFKSRIGFFLLFFVFGTAAWAQRDLSTVTGTVNDASGAVVAGAQVTITEVATGLSYMTATDTAGVFVRPALKPGTYTVEVEAQGFKKAVQRNVLLTAGERTAVNLNLQVGEASQSVEVASVAPLLQTEDAVVGGGLNSRATAELPLGGQRKIAYLARLAVGVVVDENGQAGAQGGGFSAAGVSSMGMNNYLLNGVDNNINNIDYQGNAASAVSLPPDAVGEIRILTNGYNAEYGRGGGGVMEVTMKSGTNQLHGLGYEFLQNEAMNANTWDANKSGTPKGAWRQNQFGVAAGGPIIKNRTFWFANYEGLRFNSSGSAVPGYFGASSLFTIPTPAMIQGNFSRELGPTIGTDSSGNAVQRGELYDPLSTTPNGSGGYSRTPFPGDIIPISRMDPVSLKIAQLLPAPNQNLGAAVPGGNYFAAATAQQQNDQGNLRIDHKISDKDSLFGSLSWSNGSLFNPPAIGFTAASGSLAPGYNQSQLSRLAMLSYTRIWSPAILSETRVAYNRSVQIRQDSALNFDSYTYFGIPGYNPFTTMGGGGLPSLAIDGYSTLGGPTFTPSVEYSVVWDFIQNLAINQGKHAWKFGAEFRPVRLPTFQPDYSHNQMQFTRNMTNNPAPALAGQTGDGFASFLLGYLNNFALSTNNSTNQQHFAWSFFAQDDWKVTQKLTLNLGLRYELFSPFFDNNGQANIISAPNGGGWIYQISSAKGGRTVPLSSAVAGFLANAGIPVQQGVSRYMVPWDKLDIGPRIGLAYQIESKTVIRAGYGIFYSGEQNRGGFTPLDENPPFNQDILYTGPTYTLNPYVTRLSNGFPSNIYDLNIPGSLSIHGLASDFQNPRVTKWNVSVQRELPANSALEVSYIGNYMSHLSVVWDPNMPPNNPNITSAFNSLRPNPALGGMRNYLSSFGYGNYNALGVKYEKRYSAGLQFTAAYTYGHVLSDAPTGPWALGNVTSPDARNWSAAYSNAPWDIRHNFVLNSLYELPFGKGKTFGSNWNPALGAVLGNWQMNGILTLHTGHYFTLNTLQGVGYFGYQAGGSFIHPSVAPGTSSNAAPSGGSTPNEWFNTSNIVAPAPFTQGNIGNNTNEMPGVENLDLGIFKEFLFTERYKLTFRAELFNLTNTPNFASIGSTQGVGSFGQLLTTVAGSNRRGQLGLRLVF
jgi:hypothetical protein